jgi:hypothetical protein
MPSETDGEKGKNASGQYQEGDITIYLEDVEVKGNKYYKDLCIVYETIYMKWTILLTDQINKTNTKKYKI